MAKHIAMKYIDWIEYDDGHYLAIGKAAPWDRRVQIRVPRFLARLLHRKV